MDDAVIVWVLEALAQKTNFRHARDRSLFIAGGGGFWGGITWFLGEQKGGSLKTLEGFRGGTTQICLENKDMGEGIAKVIKCY